MDHNSPEFKKLKKEWYKKLKKSGFDDIEQDEEHLSWWAKSRRVQNWVTTAEWVRSTAEYYRFAGQFLYEHEFVSKLDKLVWQLHSKGLSIREIVEKLKKKNIEKYAHRNGVHQIIKKLVKIMKDKYLNESTGLD